jgi:hypothetical protein
MQIRQKLSKHLFDAVDIAPLIFFRIAFGAIMLWEVWRYFHYDRIYRYYVQPTYFFHYYGFDWLHPLPGDGMYWLFYFIGLLSITIMLGLFYRASMVLMWVTFTYVFLLDQAQYLNHFYLISLVSFLLIFVPAHRAFSLDALLRPSIRSQTAPGWTLWLLRGQLAVVYFFGGVAKINPDWLAGEPLRSWLGARTDFPLIGHLFNEEWMVYLFSYGGLLLDLLIAPLLLWPRTRIPALIAVIGFHLANDRLFNIGVFPWFAIAATLLLLPPHWFRFWRKQPVTADAPAIPLTFARRRLILAGMAVYFALQVLIPLRHFVYPGDPSWTEEGHNLAWHMRLRSKGGSISLFASDPLTGTTWRIPAEDLLTSRQLGQMKDNPHMILRFAHYLAEQYAADGAPQIQIRAWSMMSLNNRAPQLLIDPTADLTREPDNLLASDWILPLMQQPYPSQTVPALLVSRRLDNTLALINITRTAYPLDGLQIRAGDQVLTGSDFGIDELLPGECVFAYDPDGDDSGALMPCNETGQRQEVDAALLASPLTIKTGGTVEQTCDDHVCVVTIEEA